MAIMYYRRKIILALLETLNRDVSAKSMQKYLFLFTRKQTIVRLLIFKNLLLQILHSYITLYSIPVYSALTRVPPSYTKASPR